jgi:hypothetical protein
MLSSAKEEKMPKLADSQSMVLSKAAAREDGVAVVPRGMNKAAAAKVGSSLVARKLMREIRSKWNLSSRAGNLQRLAGNCPPCAGAVEQPQRRLLGVSGLAIEDFKLKASTNAQLTSQPKPR